MLESEDEDIAILQKDGTYTLIDKYQNTYSSLTLLCVL